MKQEFQGYRRSNRARMRCGVALQGLALWLLLPAAAQAQATDAASNSIAPPSSASEQASGDSDTKEIVVTGTLLRGAPPVGSNVISVGQNQVQSQAATTSNELLATIPQVSNLFNNVPTARLGVAANQIQVVRPTLRSLTNETSSSASTLVLFDGHRVASVGVTQNAIDPDLIPPIAIERVDVMTDGGSATYGSDAVGGVINFITRQRFDGVKMQGSYGFADNYYQVQGGILVGKDWGSGSLYAAYNYQHNDPLFGRDRGYIRNVDWLSPNLTPTGRACSPGNVQIGSNIFALPSLTSATPNVCDPGEDTSVVPKSTRHSALAGLHQELAGWLTADLRVFYGERHSTSYSPFTGSANISGASSPGFTIPGVITIPPSYRSFYYTAVPGQSATANQTVLFSLAPLLGPNSARSRTSFREWGANAEFKINLNDNWQLRPLLNYSESKSEFHIDQLNGALLNDFANGPNSVTAAGAINFYDPGAGANDLANIQQLINSELAGEGRDELFDARAILDGTLFSLPGGDVKLAVGYEYMHDGFRQRTSPANGVIGALYSQPYSRYDRSVNSVFGEVQVPIVGADNRMGFIYALTLAGSVRYDHFSDFGGTTNPKIGLVYKPVSWLGLRGNYSTSFNAPSPNDQLGSLRNSATAFPFNAFVRPGDAPTANGTIALQGSNLGLRPQTAKTYSFGFDLDPPILQGFHASANYYHVNFKNIIGIPTPGIGIFANFPNNVISNPNGLSLAQITSFLNASGAPQAATVLATVSAACSNPDACPNAYELVDFRQGNYGTLKVQGLDFSATYRRPTSFGGVDASVSGNYTLSRKSQTGIGAPVINELHAINMVLPNGQYLINNASSRLQLQATLGADIGHFRAEATLDHTAGFRVVRCDPTTTPACNPSATGVPTASALPQDRVKAFDTINLFFKYDVPSDSRWFQDLSITLNINNVFDTDPPLYRAIGVAGYANGFTLGRLVQFGITKKF